MTQKCETEHLLKVTMIGDASVGKSSMLLRYIDETFEEAYVCTIGVDFKIKTLQVNKAKVKLQIWDTAGQERFKPITHCYFRGSQGCLAVFDLTNRDSFDHVPSWIKDYRENNSMESQHSIIIVGNKADSLETRTVTTEEAEALAKSMKCEYFEVSAKTAENINLIFERLAQIILQNYKPDQNKGQALKSKPVEKSGCCS